MSDDEHTQIQLWDLQKPAIPPRSRLYHLEPIGISTPYVESLTGYIARIAEAHCVSIRHLLLAEIAPMIKEGYDFKNDKGGRINNLFSSGKNRKTLNGTAIITTRLVQALEALTLRSDLRYLTMLTWTNVIADGDLIRAIKAWCPICYKEWKTAGQKIYEPLIWALDVVKVCDRHHQILQTQCSRCYKQFFQLEWGSRLGYCSKCGEWLGTSQEVQASELESLSEDELKWQNSVINNVGELVAAAPLLSSPLPRERIKKVISARANQVTEGNITAFARLVGKHCTQPTLSRWCSGRTVPQLNKLLYICDCLKISLLDFFTEEVVGAKSDTPSVKLQARQQTQPRKLPIPFDRNKAQTILQEALNESPPPTVAELSRRFGVDRGNFYRYFSDLCHAITSGHADYKKAKSLEKIRGILEAVLESNEYPPLSMREVRRRFKLPSHNLYKNCSDLCSTISARYLSYRNAAGTERIENLCQEIRYIALELHAKGIKPTNVNVKKHLTKPGILLQPELQIALIEVRRELGI